MSLQLPHDIIEPAAIGWWPLAPGWWLLLFLFAVLMVLAVRWYRQRRRELAPLREALQEHQHIVSQWQQQGDARQTTAALSALLKRAARHYYPLEPVPAMTGAAWQAFLQRTGAGAFDHNSTLAFSQLYQNESSAELTPPLEPTRRWLEAQRKNRARKQCAAEDGAPNHV